MGFAVVLSDDVGSGSDFVCIRTIVLDRLFRIEELIILSFLVVIRRHLGFVILELDSGIRLKGVWVVEKCICRHLILVISRCVLIVCDRVQWPRHMRFGFSS